MAKVNEDAIRAAMGPGLANSQATFDEVAEQMGCRSADDVHAELVKRLQAEPFAWDDEELRKIAASIGPDDSVTDPADDSSSTEEPSDDDTQADDDADEKGSAP